MDDVKKTSEKSQKHAHPAGEPETSHAQKTEKTAREIEELKSRIAELEKEATANLDGWQRERAEFVNYKKRVERDHTQSRQDITGSIIKKYLVVLDDLELALKDQPKDPAGAAWAHGIELIARKLLSILESEGVERIYQNKVQFDPNIHEAISGENNDEFESGEVIEVVRHGYKLGDRVLRPAMVRVAN